MNPGNRIAALWERAFLAERPSLSLGLFRIAVAATVGLHIFPTFLQMEDNYLSTAFRQYNPSFFTIGVLQWVDQNPDWVVWTMAAVFALAWLAFLLGFFTQVAGILMDVGCYYFYARNSMHIGTLSYDILLVTVFLMIVTPYPGDSLSLDMLIRGEPEPWRRPRPIFLQRLLQIQIAATYFCTGLNKCTAGGNWLTDNPYYYLIHSPPMGVITAFPGRAILAAHPDLCYAIGIGVICWEMTLPFLLFWRKTRLFAIVSGFVFHILLVVTMHVPTIFFFLFPPQLLLVVEPESIVAWLDRRRERWKQRGRTRLIYDGGCGFCRASLARIQALDPTGRIEAVDFRSADVANLNAALTPEACHARIHLLEPNGRLTGGFDAFRRLSLRLPLLWPLAPLLNLPGLGLIGAPVYDWVARNRFRLLHRSHSCEENACVSH
jgi:predicted DCC family thiol-disulfide oxidoreductase YuxK